MGKMQPFSAIDYDLIVDDLDRLVSLYCFTCSEVTIQSPAPLTSGGLDFKPGCKTKPSKTKASVAERELNVKLRHNELQEALHDHLAATYGKDHVGTECPCSDGRIDVVVRQKDIHWFYEIKTCLTARGCISQGLAQLLEYSYWPGAQIAERLIIVGEPKLDIESEKYLATLRTDFGLPLEYAQFDMASKTLL